MKIDFLEVMTIEPRPYQEEAVKEIIKRWQDGVTRQLVSLPTGCGKTIIFAMLAKTLKVRTLVLAHREELLFQACQKIQMVYPESDIGILKAEERRGLDCAICLASIQTAVRHIPELAARGFTLLVCDEAHHAVSRSYDRLFSELGFMGTDKDKLLVGVTATAYRGDKVGLGEVFQKLVFERSILAMMKSGYLCDLRGLEVRTNTSLAGVHTRAGDFALDELAEAIDTPERNALVADAYIQHGEGRRGVAFCVNVSHAQRVAEAFRERGVPCAAVWGDMPAERRRDVLRRYAAGELQILTNCAVLTEGWDVPETSIIMMARPTKSKGLYVQCVGRGLRIAPGKKDCLLLDFVDVAKRHKLSGVGTLAGDKPLTPSRRKTLLQAVEEEERLEAARYKLLGHAEEIELFERSQFIWQQVGAHYRIRLADGGALWCCGVDDGFSPLQAYPSGRMRKLADGAFPLDECMAICEDRAYGLDAAQPALKSASWRGAPATDKQVNLLRGMGVKTYEGITRGEASELLDEMLGAVATSAQKSFISRYGLTSHPELLTKTEAARLISSYRSQRVCA